VDAAGPVDARLGRTWIVRWDPAVDARPRVLHVPGARGDASLCRNSAGDFAAVDGYLFDRSRSGSPSAGESAPPSDAAHVLAAYGRSADSCPDALRGGFAAAVWDERRRRLTVIRDALGLHPCFYWWDGCALVVAPSIDLVLSRPQVDRAFDRTTIAEYLQNRTAFADPQETFYTRVRRLPPAHVLRLERGRLVVSRYWDPVPAGFAWAGADDIAAFDTLLARAVGRCLDAGGDSLALSGGFDSVSVAALAADARPDRPPLHAVSLGFAGTVCDERATQIAVARAFGMPHHMQTLDEALGGANPVAAALDLSAASPSPVLSPWQSAYSGLFSSASRLGLRRLLMGTGGDDLLNVDPSYAADRLAALDLAGLWRFVRACQATSPFSTGRVVRGVLWDHALAPELARAGRRILERASPTALRWFRARRRRRSLPAWSVPVDALLARDLAERRARPAPAAAADGPYVETLRRLAQSPLLLIERDQSHAWGRHLGFTFLFPYFDRDVVELTLRIRPEDLIAGGRHKAPLRRLVAARAPGAALPVKKVDFTQAVHDVLRPAGRDLWRRSGGGRRLADLGLIDAARLDRFMDEYFAGRNGLWLQAWTAMSTEAWLAARAEMSFTPERQEAAA
jgi:asparagine synthase (glutamine-hydrolysing)